jgi:hypothetical protein
MMMMRHRHVSRVVKKTSCFDCGVHRASRSGSGFHYLFECIASRARGVARGGSSYPMVYFLFLLSRFLNRNTPFRVLRNIRTLVHSRNRKLKPFSKPDHLRPH